MAGIGEDLAGDVTACDLDSKDEAAAILSEDVDDAETGAAGCVSGHSVDETRGALGRMAFSAYTEW